MLTLLAPARDKTVALAAINAGADAVYIGAPKFGARHSAGNSIDDIRELAEKAAVYGVKVLVTVNTLLSDEERKEAAEMIWDLYEAGVDAVIIQDLRLLNENLPPIRLHASTQCDNRASEQVVRLQQLGFKRAVLARELNIEEIKQIRNATIKEARGGSTIELEAFVHGALCVSYSGRCYMSEVLMNRSANRGECAQMCRMRYDLLDDKGNEIYDDNGQPIHRRYLLSLQDMDRHLYIKQLIDAGVTTFKIEGRLKDADYVCNIVAFYRQIIDHITGKQSHRYYYNFLPDPQKTFHRGSTDYFISDRKRPMANFFTPKSTGEKVGRVVGQKSGEIVIDLLPGVEIANGDGLCYADEGFAVNSIRRADNQTNRLYIIIRTESLPPAGADIYRSKDVKFLSSLKAQRKIPVKVSITEINNGFELKMYDVSNEKKCISTLRTDDDKQPAKDEIRSVVTMREQLQKTGNTPFVVEETEVLSKPYFVPVSKLNLWRRTLTDQAVINLKESYFNRCKDTEKNIPTGSIEYSSLLPHIRESRELMTCKYCLLYELGHCMKESALKRQPRYLRLQNGKMMQLHFNCAKCEMQILSIN